jgi:renalase
MSALPLKKSNSINSRKISSQPSKKTGRKAHALAANAPLSQQHFAIVGAGLSGIACARTLHKAGHRVTIFEQAPAVGGRTATVTSTYGSFDAGTQYFTLRDPRFARALDTVPGICKPWSASSIRLLSADGTIASTDIPTKKETHWVASPGMQTLAQTWAQPLIDKGDIHVDTFVRRIAADTLQPAQWQIHTDMQDGGQQIHAGFDGVILALPAPAAHQLLADSQVVTVFSEHLSSIEMLACWTLMLAYPQAVRPGLTTLGPQWNAAHSTHHRIGWLARESSKPGRLGVERWTLHANPEWSTEHQYDDAQRVQLKLLKAFAEITGIHAPPAHIQLQLWKDARVKTPAKQTHLWDNQLKIGACGDWCMGPRLEDAFISGLEMALSVA